MDGMAADAAADRGNRKHRIAAAAAAAGARRGRALPGARAAPAGRSGGSTCRSRSATSARCRTPTWCARRCAGSTPSIHLAATIRDQPPHRIEELNGLATVRLLRAAERSGVRALRLLQRPQRLAPPSARASSAPSGWPSRRSPPRRCETTVFAPSIVYDHSDPWVTLLRRFSFLPVLPVSGDGQARFQPIWADDAARCVVAALARRRARTRYELAGPETLSYDEMSDLVSRIAGRPRPLVHLPLPLIRAGLIAIRSVFGEAVFATWEEAELMEVPMISERGTADARGARSRAEEDERCPGGVLGAQRLALAAVGAAMLAPGQAPALTLVPPKPNVFFGVSDRGTTAEFNEFAALVGKHPALLQTFHPWGNSLNAAYERWRETGDAADPAHLDRRRPDAGRDDHPAADRARRRRRLPAAAQRLLRQTRAARLHPAARASPTAASTPGRRSTATAARKAANTRPAGTSRPSAGSPRSCAAARRWKGSTRPWPKSACRRSTAPKGRTRRACRRRR